MRLDSTIQERTTFLVDPARLAHGEYEEDKIIGQGDMPASYSADRIADAKPIRQPFQWQGSLWVCVTMGHGLTDMNKFELVAFRLVPTEIFHGEAVSYATRTATEELCQIAREDPLGFYHGITVRHGNKKFVLCGPPASFLPDHESENSKRANPVQLGLF